MLTLRQLASTLFPHAFGRRTHAVAPTVGPRAAPPAPGQRAADYRFGYTTGNQPGNDAGVDFRLLAENSSDIICRIGSDFMPLYVSPSVEPALGWTPAQMREAGPAFIHPDDRPTVADVHNRLSSGVDQTAKVSFRLMKRDGTPLWVEANCRAVRSSSGGKSDVVIVMRDISDRKRLEDELRKLSLTDGLTGLYNRRAFDEMLEQAWRRTLASGSELSLLLLDIDHFKRFNDAFGHQAGDDCLRVVSSAVTAALRGPTDTAARYGGEEIAVILPGTPTDGALAVAHAIRERIEAQAVYHPGGPNAAHMVTASIGVATAYAREGATMKMPEGLLLAADGALYKAKQHGRNRVEVAVVLAPRGPAPAD